PRELQGHEMEFIFRSLVELKLQIEQLKSRIDQAPQRVEVIDMGRAVPVPYEETGDRAFAAHSIEPAAPEPEIEVIYRPGMKMAEVEKATIVAALKETNGNRRKAA